MALLLKQAGIPNVRALTGGYEEWAERGNQIEKGDRREDHPPVPTK